MFISHYKQQVSIVLQCVQVITILQRAIPLNHNFSPLPHIPTSATLSLTDLWQRMPFNITSSTSLLFF